jgi:hypothetical protein
MAHKQAIIELSHLEFCQYGKELAADLFMDIAKSSPYVGLKSDKYMFSIYLLDFFYPFIHIT